MAELTTFDGHPGRTLHMWLLRQVRNSGELQQHVQNHSLDPECSLINATLVADAWLVHLAAFKALTAEKRGLLRTRSLHGELVNNLSGTKHIAESFRRYGVSPDTKDLLVCRFDMQPGKEEAILQVVQGQLEPLSSLSNLADMDTLQKFHKWSPAEEKLGDVSGSIACRIAARDC